MKEGIYKLLSSGNPILSLSLLHDDKIELDEKSKILVSLNWIRAGSPKEYEPRLISKLGLDWEFYLNPLLLKLYDDSLINLARKVPHEYNYLKDEKHLDIIEHIILDKLSELERKVAPHGFTSKKSMVDDSSKRNLMRYEISSIGTERELMRVELEARGYTYTPRVYLLETGIDLSDKLTEGSITNLKGLMYNMSDSGKWDLVNLNKSIELIVFEPLILNRLMSAIHKKYGN